MRRGRAFIYMAIILILIVVGAAVVYNRFFNAPLADGTNGDASPTPVVDLVEVIVFTQSVARGQMIDETVLGKIDLPREIFIQGMYSWDDLPAVVGRQAKFDVDSGITLTANMLVDSAEQLSSAGSIAALTIPAGKVAVSVPITRLSSVSYAPRSGDHVSVIATMLFVDLDSGFQSILPNNTGGIIAPGPNLILGGGTVNGLSSSFIAAGENVRSLTAQPYSGGGLAVLGRTEVNHAINETVYVVPSERQRARLVTQSILQDVIVLKVGDFKYADEEEWEAENEAAEEIQAAEETTQQVTEETPQTKPKPEPPNVITIVVSPQDALTLNYLMYSGAEITFALRAAGDETVFETNAATLQYILDAYNIPVPAKLPYGFEPRLDSLVPPTQKNNPVPVE